VFWFSRFLRREEKRSATLSLLSPFPPSSLLFAVSSVFSPLRRPKNDENPPRSTTLSLLTVSPPSSLIFAVFVTMETHHDRRLSCSEWRLFHLLSSPHGLFHRSFRCLSRSLQLRDQLPKKSKKDFSIGYCGEEEVSQETCRR
uniref:Uncharacterized protein n=1 Tax=Brassica oleracea var. oleracea TaxID=109376 RepID=A0A0D3AEF9_BRAOL